MGNITSNRTHVPKPEPRQEKSPLQRTAEIEVERKRAPNLTAEERGRIIRLAKSGTTQVMIAETMGRSIPCVSKAVRKARIDGLL